MKRLVAWLAQWKWAVFAASAALFILGGMGMQRVVFDPDVLVYFDRSMPERVALETMEQRFGRTNEIVFVLRSRDDASMLSPARHEAMQWLQGKARALKEAIAVRSPLTLPAEDGNASAAPDPAEIRRAAAEAGFSARSVISEDETVAAVAVLFPRSSRGDISIDAVTTAAQQRGRNSCSGSRRRV
jgi:predicted RND superfamily exporter protein